jgi:hypothetical protein
MKAEAKSLRLFIRRGLSLLARVGLIGLSRES